MMHGTGRSAGAQGGVVLVIVLWVLALLVVIAGGYSVTTRTETVLTARMVTIAKARALAEAGVWLAIRDLVQAEGPERWRTDGEARTLKFDGGAAVVVLQDESGKIDLNAADVGLIYSLLLSATGDGNAAVSMLQAILDWRDGDGGKRKSGAEVEEYAAAARAYGPRNGPFSAVDELRLVLGMSDDLYSRVSPALTVYSGDSGLNPEVAVREALLGLPDMTPQSVDEYLVDRTATTQEFDQRFLSSTRRRVVTIVSQGEIGESRFRLEVVVRIRRGSKDLYSLMAWRESGAVQASRTQAGGAPGFQMKLPFTQWLRDFLEWWLTGMGYLLPEAARRRLWQPRDILYIDVDRNSLSARHVEAQSRQERELPPDDIPSWHETLRGHDCNVIVRLHTSQVLARTVLLPLAAERNVREVLAFDMDRQTPFTEEQVLFDYRVIGRDAENDRLRVELLFTRRDQLEPLLEKFISQGLIPHRVTVQKEVAEWNLLPPPRRPAPAPIFSGRTRALAWATLALLLAALYVPPLIQAWRLRILEEKVIALRPQAIQARALFEEFQALVARPRFLAAAQDSRAPVIDILNELTTRLPNHTWISQLTLRGDRLELQGESEAAGAIIELLDQSGYLKDVQFSSATTKSTATNKDRFHVSARVAWSPSA